MVHRKNLSDCLAKHGSSVANPSTPISTTHLISSQYSASRETPSDYVCELFLQALCSQVHILAAGWTTPQKVDR